MVTNHNNKAETLNSLCKMYISCYINVWITEELTSGQRHLWLIQTPPFKHLLSGQWLAGVPWYMEQVLPKNIENKTIVNRLFSQLNRHLNYSINYQLHCIFMMQTFHMKRKLNIRSKDKIFKHQFSDICITVHTKNFNLY